MSEKSANDGKHASAYTSVETKTLGWCISATLKRSYEVLWCKNLFGDQKDVLKQQLPSQKTLILTTKTVDQLYGPMIRSGFDQAFEYRYTVLPVSERSKDITTVMQICHEATEFGLGPRAQIVAIGGGVCLDCAALAAALFRRGIAHVKIPTSLIGIVDAGVSIRNSVNFNSLKSHIGTLNPPIAVLLDPIFLKTLPNRYLRCGIAEILKLGLVCEDQIYNLVEQNCGELIRTHFQEPEAMAQKLMSLSIDTLIGELSSDLFEMAHRQKTISFGHTFSPWIEAASDYSISHGEAVAMDMAISCCISNRMGVLDKDVLERILILFDQLELPIYDDVVVPDQLWSSLGNMRTQRDGKLNLVLPTNIGKGFFIDDMAQLEESLVLSVLDYLHKRAESRGMLGSKTTFKMS